MGKAKVKLTKNMAIWYLENPDNFYMPGDISSDMDEDHLIAVQMATDVLLGGTIVGRVLSIGYTPGDLQVKFKTPYGEYQAYYQIDRDVEYL